MGSFSLFRVRFLLPFYDLKPNLNFKISRTGPYRLCGHVVPFPSFLNSLRVSRTNRQGRKLKLHLQENVLMVEKDVVSRRPEVREERQSQLQARAGRRPVACAPGQDPGSRSTRPHTCCHDYPTGVSTGAASVASSAKGKVYGHSPGSGLSPAQGGVTRAASHCCCT